MALIVVDRAGENQIAVGAGANAAVSPEAVEAAVARAADWAGCVLVSTEITPAAVDAAVRTANAHGLLCILNPAPVLPGLAALLALAPVLTPNETELAALHALVDDARPGGCSTNEMALAIASRSKAPVIVTLGGAGASVVDEDQHVTELPALAVAEVADTTGAGDTFNGVIAAALAAGVPMSAAVGRGVTAASLSVGWVGARAGMPTAAAIDAAHASLQAQAR
jgi:ribokinase